MKTALATFRDGKNNRGPLAEMYIPTSKNVLSPETFPISNPSFCNEPITCITKSSVSESAYCLDCMSNIFFCLDFILVFIKMKSFLKSLKK